MVQPGAVVCLHGDLGSGKTTIVKGIAKGFGGLREDEVNSPTFVYLNIYDGEKPVYHFDLYRLNDPEDFFHLGFDDYLFSEGVCCIEWADRIKGFLPPRCWHVHLQHEEEGLRTVYFYETH